MSVTAPPKPKSDTLIEDPADREALEALIEEARQRTRRRRRRYAGVALLIAAGIGSAVIVFGGSGGPAAISPPTDPPGALGGAQPSQALRVRNGPLTVIDGDGIVAVSSRGDTHELFRCEDAPAPRFCTIIEGVTWSPTGDKLLFSTTTISTYSRFQGMHVLDLASGKVRSAGGEGFSPSWSRDGRIALVVWRNFPRELGAIQIRRIVGSHVTDRWLDTGTDGYDSSPSWSPDGTRLVFATRLNGEWTISIINADGSHRRLLARHASWPAWSPDGRIIAYRAPCGVKLITSSGRDATPDTGSHCRSLRVRGIPYWSPDGKWIAISKQDGPRAFLGGYAIYVIRRDGSHGSYGLATSSSPLGLGAPIAWQPIPKGQTRRSR
jgi:dipeptidyl aminopeptidase/acylaminoacyl peptidase